MKKKIISLFLSSIMLVSSVAYANPDTDALHNYLNNYFSSYIESNVLLYSKMRHENSMLEKAHFFDANIDDTTRAVLATVDTVVSVSETDSWNSTASSSNEKQTFQFKVSLDMSNVKTAFEDLYDDRVKSFENGSSEQKAVKRAVDSSAVEGEFFVDVTYDSRIIIPDAFKLNPKSSINLVQDTDLFEVNTATLDETNHTLKVAFKVKDGKTVKTNLVDDTKAFNNLSVTLTGFSTETKNQFLDVTAKLTGDSYTKFIATDDTNEFAIIKYISNEDTASFKIYTTGGGSTKHTSKEDTTIKVTEDNTGTKIPSKTEVKDDGTIIVSPVEQTKADDDSTYTFTITKKPEPKEGFIENGYSTTPFAGGDPEYNGTSDIIITSYDSESPAVLYPRYVNITVPPQLNQGISEDGNTKEHILYIVGYPDGEVKPKGNITREEITAAFYRLLDLHFRSSIETTEQDFPDVESERWSNKSVATMKNGGFIVGDENGNFNPGTPITRAEFAVLASNFAPADAAVAENYFTDIDGHWAKEYILKVAGQYWISGYGDGTFNPDAYITRAEAMSIINRMLVRYADRDTVYVREWPDLYKSDWYYEAVTEATTHNYYARLQNQWSEVWVEDAYTDTKNAVKDIMVDTYGEQ